MQIKKLEDYGLFYIILQHERKSLDAASIVQLSRNREPGGYTPQVQINSIERKESYVYIHTFLIGINSFIPHVRDGGDVT